MARRQKNSAKKEMIFFLVSFILVMAAVVGGYIFSNKIANDIVDSEDKSDSITMAENIGTEDGSMSDLVGNGAEQSDTSLNEELGMGIDSGSAIVPVPIDMHPINLIFIRGTDNRISELKLELLDCVKMEMLIISMPGDFKYTMSSGLYRELTAGNVTLPQTVKFSELYHYYNDDRAYDTGRIIISEMLGINVGYYTSIDEGKYYSSYVVDSEKETAYELETMVNNAVTNWDYPSRVKYLPVYISLRAEDVQFAEAPFKINNESTVLDISGVVAIIHQSGVDIWENEE